MSELFLELYSEEIPVSFFDIIKEKFRNTFYDIFINSNLFKELKGDFCQIYTTPCRIIFFTDVLGEEIVIKHREVVGPKIGASDEEINGFLKAFNIDSINKLLQRDENYIFVQENVKIKTKDIIKNVILDVLNILSSSFPQTITWDNLNQTKWIAPLRNILCLFNGEVLDFKFCNLQSSNLTYPHKILVGLDKKIKILNFDDYKNKMKENYVIFDQNEREKIILSKILKIENTIGHSVYKVRNNQFEKKLIKEIVNTTEYPNVFLGEFDPNFLRLPEVIITNTVCKKYKSFCLIDDSNKFLSNKFITFTNSVIGEEYKSVISGINGVIDIEFTNISNEVTEYLSENLDSKIEKLKKIPYYIGFGTLFNKVERSIVLAKFISLWTPFSDLMAIEQAAKLCKIDMSSHLVREDFELKGYLSAYYARFNNYSEDICKGIEEYYEPRNLSDEIPESDIGKILSIAGRLDNITTLFITNKESSSSRDPFAIRKNVTSIIKIIVEGKIDVPLNILVYKSISLFKTGIYKNNKNSNISTKKQINEIENKMLDLFNKRFVSYLIESNYNPEVINAVVNVELRNVFKVPIVLTTLCEKISQITNYIENNKDNFVNIKNTYKRLNNILEDFKITDVSSIMRKIFHTRHFRNKQEKEIINKIKEVDRLIKNSNKNHDYNACLELLLSFNKLLNEYFKDNLIKTNNAGQTKSRLLLLYKIRKIFDSFLNFSEFKNF